MSCPNKTYKSSEDQILSDWEILVNSVGEENAMAFFIQNNEEMPTIEQINAIILANDVLQKKVKNEEGESKGKLVYFLKSRQDAFEIKNARKMRAFALQIRSLPASVSYSKASG